MGDGRWEEAGGRRKEESKKKIQIVVYLPCTCIYVPTTTTKNTHPLSHRVSHLLSPYGVPIDIHMTYNARTLEF